MENIDEIEYMDEFIKVVQRPKSGFLYHYTNASSVKSIIEKSEFWASRWDFLNDITEFNNIDELIYAVVQSKSMDKEYAKILYNRIIEEINRLNSDPELRSGYYVLSFSLRNDSPLLWSSYSNFSGYCMEFSFDKLLESINTDAQIKPTYWRGEVIYKNNIKMKRINDAFEKCMEDLNLKYNRRENELIDFMKYDEKEIEDFIMGFSIPCILYSMFCKKECFSGEEEYRFIFSAFHKCDEKHKKRTSDQMHFRERNNLLLPYVKIPLNFEIGIPVRSVIVGAKNNIDLAVKGIEYFFKRQDYDVLVERSKIPLRY